MFQELCKERGVEKRNLNILNVVSMKALNNYEKQKLGRRVKIWIDDAKFEIIS